MESLKKMKSIPHRWLNCTVHTYSSASSPSASPRPPSPHSRSHTRSGGHWPPPAGFAVGLNSSSLQGWKRPYCHSHAENTVNYMWWREQEELARPGSWPCRRSHGWRGPIVYRGAKVKSLLCYLLSFVCRSNYFFRENRDVFLTLTKHGSCESCNVSGCWHVQSAENTPLI